MKNCRRSVTPAAMSPPTRFALCGFDVGRRHAPIARARSRGIRARIARSAARCGRACRRSMRPARDSNPTPHACRPARATDRTASVGSGARTADRQSFPPTPRAPTRAISLSVPPRCTVPARRHPSAFHGIGAASAQSTLNTPMPIAIALELSGDSAAGMCRPRSGAAASARDRTARPSPAAACRSP